jgi:UDP-glucuronate 4-epimerase
MRILLTGIAGFIGSHLAEALLAAGHSVVGLDNFDPYYDPAIKERNIQPLLPHLHVVRGDILDPAGLDTLFEASRPELVVHLAALAGVRPSVAAPWRYQQVNTVGTSMLLEAMVRHDCEQMLFASSSSVYGHNTKLPYVESDRVDRPASPYAASKRGAELLLSSMQSLHNLTVCCLRFFTVYGPRQRPDMAIHKFGRLLLAGEPLPVFGDGQTSRDYTYIDDITAGVCAAIANMPPGFSIFNFGNRRPVRLHELIETLAKTLAVEAKVDYRPAEPGDVPHTLADITAAQTRFGYAPKTRLDEGLSRFATWLKSEERPAR